MLYIRFKNGIPAEISKESPGCGNHWNTQNGWQSARDAQSFEQAATWSRYMTAMSGKTYLPIDNGPAVWPQYGVIDAPSVGDKVSRSFNGDSYPEGKVVKITKGWQVTTSTGAKFRRIGETGGWKECNGSFWMISGHHEEQNPHF